MQQITGHAERLLPPCARLCQRRTALRPRLSREQAAQARPPPAQRFKWMESQLRREIFNMHMQGHDLVLCTTEFHILKTIQSTFYVVSDFSYIESFISW